MLEDLEFDDAGSPAIGLVPPGISWEQVHDHIKIAHHHLLVPPDAEGEYTGVYWTGREMALVSDLGSDQEEAIEEFRAAAALAPTEFADQAEQSIAALAQQPSGCLTESFRR